MLLKWEILWPLEIPHETAFSVVNTDYCSCVQLLAIQFLTIVFQNYLMVSNNHWRFYWRPTVLNSHTKTCCPSLVAEFVIVHTHLTLRGASPRTLMTQNILSHDSLESLDGLQPFQRDQYYITGNPWCGNTAAFFCQNTSLGGKYELSTILDLHSTQGGEKITRWHSAVVPLYKIIFQHSIKTSESLWQQDCYWVGITWI